MFCLFALFVNLTFSSNYNGSPLFVISFKAVWTFWPTYHVELAFFVYASNFEPDEIVGTKDGIRCTNIVRSFFTSLDVDFYKFVSKSF